LLNIVSKPQKSTILNHNEKRAQHKLIIIVAKAQKYNSIKEQIEKRAELILFSNRKTYNTQWQ